MLSSSSLLHLSTFSLPKLKSVAYESLCYRFFLHFLPGGGLGEAGRECDATTGAAYDIIVAF
jgi:hypothetical protein